MRTLSPVAPRSSASPSHLEKDLATCSHVYLRCDRVRRPLKPPDDNPFRVLSRGTKTLCIQRPNREEVVSVDRPKASVPDLLSDEPCGPLPSTPPPLPASIPSPLFSLFPPPLKCILRLDNGEPTKPSDKPVPVLASFLLAEKKPSKEDIRLLVCRPGQCKRIGVHWRGLSRTYRRRLHRKADQISRRMGENVGRICLSVKSPTTPGSPPSDTDSSSSCDDGSSSAIESHNASMNEGSLSTQQTTEGQPDLT
ncbi:hypothetical protein SprV_0200959700 [Sparganum proliferum]